MEESKITDPFSDIKIINHVESIQTFNYVESNHIQTEELTQEQWNNIIIVSGDVVQYKVVIKNNNPVKLYTGTITDQICVFTNQDSERYYYYLEISKPILIFPSKEIILEFFFTIPVELSPNHCNQNNEINKVYNVKNIAILSNMTSEGDKSITSESFSVSCRF